MDINYGRRDDTLNETSTEDNALPDTAQSDGAAPMEEQAVPEALEDAAPEQNPEEQPAESMSPADNSSPMDTVETPDDEAVLVPAVVFNGDDAGGTPGTTTVTEPEKKADSDLQNIASVKTRTPANAQMVSELVLSILHGMTDEGGTAESKANAQAKCNVLRQAVTKSVEGMKTLEEKKNYVEHMYEVAQPLEAKAKTFFAFSSVLGGEAVNAMKDGIPHGQFLPFLRRNFSDKKIRRMQEGMSLARMNGVERHLDLGVTELLQFPPIIKKYGFGNDPDSIQTIFDQAKNVTGFLGADYETLARIAIGDFKLKKATLTIDPLVLGEFITSGFEIKSSDIKEMQAMQKRKEEAEKRGEDAPDPSTFLLDVIKNAGTRVFALTQGPKAETETPATPVINNINATLVSTTNTLTQALSLPEIPKVDIDRAALRDLMDVLKKFDEALNRS